jgi:hypothetical protein
MKMNVISGVELLTGVKMKFKVDISGIKFLAY